VYGWATWLLTLRDEHRLRLFEHRVLRKIFGPKRYEVTSYHLFSFFRSIQDYKIHMDMETVTVLGIKRQNQHKSVQQSHGLIQYLMFQHNANYSV